LCFAEKADRRTLRRNIGDPFNLSVVTPVGLIGFGRKAADSQD
jgi:hypothetical protein